MTIENVDLEQLPKIVAGLVREGLTFTVRETSRGLWTITLNGGY